MISRDGVFKSTSTDGQISVTSYKIFYAVTFLLIFVFLFFVVIFYPRFVISMKLNILPVQSKETLGLVVRIPGMA